MKPILKKIEPEPLQGKSWRVAWKRCRLKRVLWVVWDHFSALCWGGWVQCEAVTPECQSAASFSCLVKRCNSRGNRATQHFLLRGGWSHLHFLLSACWDSRMESLGTSLCTPNPVDPTPIPLLLKPPFKGQQQCTFQPSEKGGKTSFGRRHS